MFKLLPKSELLYFSDTLTLRAQLDAGGDVSICFPQQRGV